MKQRQLNTVIDVAHSAGKTYVAQGWRMRLRKTVIASLLSVSLMMFSASSWAAIWDLSQEGGDVNCPGSKKVVLDQTEKENRISQKITTFKDSRSDVICKLSDNEKELFSASYQRKERAAITVNKINLASIKVKVALNSDFNQYLKGQKKLEQTWRSTLNKTALRKDRNATIYVSICIPSIGRDEACTVIKKNMMFWNKRQAWNIKFPAALKKALETFIVENGFLMKDYKKSVIVHAYVTNRAGDVWYAAREYRAALLPFSSMSTQIKDEMQYLKKQSMEYTIKAAQQSIVDIWKSESWDSRNTNYNKAIKLYNTLDESSTFPYDDGTSARPYLIKKHMKRQIKYAWYGCSRPPEYIFSVKVEKDVYNKMEAMCFSYSKEDGSKLRCNPFGPGRDKLLHETWHRPYSYYKDDPPSCLRMPPDYDDVCPNIFEAPGMTGLVINTHFLDGGDSSQRPSFTERWEYGLASDYKFKPDDPIYKNDSRVPKKECKLIIGPTWYTTNWLRPAEQG